MAARRSLTLSVSLHTVDNVEESKPEEHEVSRKST
jgi:hypothetical protein